MEEELVAVDEAVVETVGDDGESGTVSDEFAEIRAHFDGDGLSDEEVDVIADLAVGYLRDLLGFFGEEHATIEEFEGDEGELILDISGGDLAVLIGRHGRTLDSLQMILSSFMSSRLHFYYPLVVDIEGYKNRRRHKVESIARNAAARAKRQRGSVSLAPMNAYERRIVHLTLVEDLDVNTHSEGDDPYRHVVVTYVR